MAFYGLEPWGAEVEWLRTGTVAAMIGNSAPNRKRGSKTFKPGDFVPKPKAKSTGLREAFLAAFGGRIKRKKQSARTDGDVQ